VAIITTVEPVHLEFFAGIEAIADAKAEIFEGVEAGGAVVLNRDNSQFARLSRRAKTRGISRIVSFGANKRAEARLLDISLHATCSAVHAEILGHEVTYKLGMPGRHMAMNSLAVLAAASLAGAELHGSLNDAIKANHVDLVYCCGPLMLNLWDALSTGKRGGYADSAASLQTQVVSAVRAGDAVMIKGSFGSKMKTIVTALEKRFPGNAALDEAAV